MQVQGGRSIAQIDTQCLQQYAFFTGRPMADPCASILRPQQCVCLAPPLSDRWATDLLGDLCVTVLNMLKTATMASMARCEHPLCHP